MSEGTSIYGMIAGIGDAFGRSYESSRKAAQEDEAPAIFGQLLGLNGGPSTAPTQGATLGTLGQVQPAPSARAVPTFVGLSGANPSADKKLNGSNADFVSAMLPHAIEASKATGVDPRIILAQSAIETGFGRSAPGNNYFGIKSHGESGGNTMATTEVVNGQPVRVNDSFRAFPSMAASAAGYADFLNKNPRYAGLKSAQGLEAQAAALQASGYATDPHYGGKVLSIARRLPVPGGAGAAPAPGQPVAIANNEAETQALEQRMGMVPTQTAEADMPAQGASPAGFVIPGQAQAAPATTPAPAPAAAPAPAPAQPQGFPGFGTGASRMSPEQAEVLKTAWRNPLTRPMATSIYGEMLKGQASPWKLQQMGDQPVLFNERTAQIVPVGQGKRSTATVGNTVIDTATGQPIYRGEQEPKTATVGNTIVDVRTGQPIYQGEQEPKTATVEGTVVDTRTGLPIYTAPAKPVTVSAGSSLVNPTTGQPIFSAPDKDKSAESEAKLRTEFTKNLGTFGEVQDGYRRLIAATEQREANPSSVSPASDIGLIFGYMKMLDPGSVVREGEYATAQNAAGIPTRVMNAYNKALSGEFLTPDQRQDFVDTAGRLYGQAREGAEGVASRYRDLAKGQGLDEGRVVSLPSPLVGPKVGSRKAEGASVSSSSVAKGADRQPLPEGYSAARALAEAKASVAAGKDKGVIAERLRRYGIDPKRLED